jgi:menaquinone-dependent protoporphyrinogen oxidase
MRLIAKRAGGDTDTSVDYVYTDWEEVKRFTERFLEKLSPPAK